MISRKELLGEQVLYFNTSVSEEDAVLTLTQKKEQELDDDGFMLLNIDFVCKQLARWKKELPEVKPFYAVKSNPDGIILKSLAKLGTGFDCASKGEINQILNLGVSPDRIIYAHTCKAPSGIRLAKSQRVELMTFDTLEELLKIKAIYPESRLVLRIISDDPDHYGSMGNKFGADPEKEAPRLLEAAKELGLSVHGISFHVGSMCLKPELFVNALKNCRLLIDMGRSLGFENMEMVDIGGGFMPNTGENSFEQFAKVIRQAIDHFFPKRDVRFIAEPGRFFSAYSCTAVVNVSHAAAKKMHDGESVMSYYINDGIFGLFRSRVTANRIFTGQPLIEETEEPKERSILFGHTCHPCDVIEDDRMIKKLRIGDWIVYKHMGSYTRSSATHFNGFEPLKYYYAIGRSAFEALSN